MAYDDGDIAVLSLETGQKRILIEGGTSPRYSVTLDGERFLMISDTSSNVECKLLHVVANWSRELTRRATAASAALPRTRFADHLPDHVQARQDH